MPDSTRPRKRGPQARAARNDRALIEAAREVFIAQGFDAPVSAIAERAGVGMGSLYRRYATKEELLQRLCADSMEHLAEAARAGLAIDDPLAGPRPLHHRVHQLRLRRTGPAGRNHRTHPANPARRRTGPPVHRRPDHPRSQRRRPAHRRDPLDIFLLIGQFSRPGPAPSRDTEQHVRSRLLAIAVDGLKATNTTPLPAPPPNPHEYQAMWATNQT
ncbi:TetR/AcrR family transcriptional regulator [Actinomadura madurae]|uniref:TetR/AcrR family transcriptional regulator n=1 Tax=Actinomadura madurae TaxID=1993 RepID=UPI0020D233A6|nr:TetR/AcrR family transcriptional regulator [Actinomadura madurae]MCQ0017811.1 TetR/AcrR family transcriptional regulator [Actinomadura madurae]